MSLQTEFSKKTLAEHLSHFDIRVQEVLAKHTSFQIGGSVDFWVEPRSQTELIELLNLSREFGQPLYLIGGGNNILVEDEGLRGIAVHLGNPVFREVELLTENKIRAGAGTDLGQLLSWSAGRGLSGLEFLAGIPGTMGGAIWMNAGRGIQNTEGGRQKAEGREQKTEGGEEVHHIGELVESVTLMDENGKIRTVSKDEIEFGYRHTNLPCGIILSALLSLGAGDPEQIREQIRQNVKTKIKTQDLYFPSAGCIFKNPTHSKKSSGQLIDEIGLKGVRIGQAQISEKHANFIINRNSATCKEVLTLIRLIQHMVREEYDLQLELELRIIGSSRRSHGGVVQ